MGVSLGPCRFFCTVVLIWILLRIHSLRPLAPSKLIVFFLRARGLTCHALQDIGSIVLAGSI